MHISVYLPLVLALMLALAVPILTCRLSPALATRILTVTAVASALASIWGLTLLALTLVIDTAPAAALLPSAVNPVPVTVAAVAALALAGCLGDAVRVMARRRRVQREMRAICALCPAAGELAVLVDDTPHAFAVPGSPGRILVSTGLLRAADDTDRRIVLAHERAHLRHHHHRYRAAVDLAAALNPVLIPARIAVAYLIERWADEDAAHRVGSRERTARTLASIALAAPGPGGLRSPALGFGAHSVTRRVRALQLPLRPSRHILALACAVPAVLATVAAADATLAFTRILTALAWT